MAKKNSHLSRKTGFSRIKAAAGYSLSGLKASYSNEEAFRQELLLFIVMLPVLILLPLTTTFKVILLLANCLVLITELLNSAIESIVDLVSPDYHELAKRAKDTGSAAVFISLLLACTIWTSAIYTVCIQ
jgi:diacylglycerol kinase (ATP)